MDTVKTGFGGEVSLKSVAIIIGILHTLLAFIYLSFVGGPLSLVLVLSIAGGFVMGIIFYFAIPYFS